MVRIIDVVGPRRVVVDRNGVAQTLVLGGVAIPPGEEEAATAYLRKTFVGSWALVETNAGGEAYLFRSPDALYVNGELARRAYVHPGVEMIYLGESIPVLARAEKSGTKAKGNAAPAESPSPVVRTRRAPRRRR